MKNESERDEREETTSSWLITA